MWARVRRLRSRLGRGRPNIDFFSWYPLVGSALLGVGAAMKQLVPAFFTGLTLIACASLDSRSATCRSVPAYCPAALLVDDAAEAASVGSAGSPGTAGAAVAATVGLTLEDTPAAGPAPGNAPRWRNAVNPDTGAVYSSEEEYDRVPRYPGQTCTNSKLDELQSEKDALAQSVPPLDPSSPGSSNPKRLARVPCSRIRARLSALQALLAKRRQIQTECFGGKADPSHAQALEELARAVENTIALEAVNCAPGHPMAGL